MIRLLQVILAWALVLGGGPGVAQAPPMLELPARREIAPVIECGALQNRDFASLKAAPTEILSAELEQAGAGRPETCVVKGYVAPQVQFELRLPTKGYTGRYLQIGCGGSCGYIRLEAAPACDNAMAHSGAFAVAATNTGHVGNSLWARDNPRLQEDYAHRAVHVVSLAAKAIISTYYGKLPEFSYFQGCSNGGREGLVEAQRYSDDFDGIVAGAPAVNISSAMLRFYWQDIRNRRSDGTPILTKTAVATLHKAVMGSCDALDGLKDGQIDEPRACSFEPGSLICKDPRHEQPGSCVSQDQVETARAFYQGPVDEEGEHLTPGGASYGSELTWAAPGRGRVAELFLRDMIYGSRRPQFRIGDFRFGSDEAKEVRELGTKYDARNPDLSGFRDAGGKLIIWEGAADPSASMHATLAYLQEVRDALGGTGEARKTVRFFRLPGVYHCGGGYMPYQANFLGAMVNWVERGIAPDQVIAAAASPAGVRTRPIYAYPVIARYSGKGSIDDASSFTGVWPKRAPDDHYGWAGAWQRSAPGAGKASDGRQSTSR